MKELDYKFYLRLREGSVSSASIPKTIKDSLAFKNLLAANTLSIERVGRGSKVFIKNALSFDAFFNGYFPEQENIEIPTKLSNIRTLRDSKARRTNSSSIFLLRGFQKVNINGKDMDLEDFTTNFGLFGVQKPQIICQKLCFVENLDSFLKAENLLGREYVYLHKYGRVGIDSIKDIHADEVLVFVDYDFNGLDEFLRIREVHHQAKLFIPENFESLFSKYSKTLDGKQKESSRLATSQISEVRKISDTVLKTNRFLEQEVVINA